MPSTVLGTRNIEANTISNTLHGAFLPVRGENRKIYTLCYMMICSKEDHKARTGRGSYLSAPMYIHATTVARTQ